MKSIQNVECHSYNERHWSVYCHTNKINNKKYYGITGRKPESRWGLEGNHYKGQPFYNAILKYGWDSFRHDVIATNLTQLEAEQMEIDLIRDNKTMDRNYGYNAASGGQILRKDIIPLYQYDTEGNLYKYWEDYHDAADYYGMHPRVIRRLLFKDYRLQGKYILRSEPDNNIQPRPQIISRTKPIVQYNLQGNFVAKYDCILDAARIYNVPSGRISTCCDGKNQESMGYYWFYADDPQIEDILHERCIKYKTTLPFRLNEYNIDQYDMDDNLVGTFRDMRSAADTNGFKYNVMANCLYCADGKYKSIQSFKWKFGNRKRGIDLTPVLYMQHDKRWANNDYSAKGEKTTIKAEGCGVACSAMVIATLVDGTVTPADTAKWSLENGFKAKGQGTYYSYFKPQFEKYGIKCSMINSKNCYHDPKAKCHKEALDAIDNGDLVIAVMGKGNWTTSGHYVLWYGMEGNNVLINDPWSIKKQQTNASYDLFRNEVKYYWVISVPDKYKEDGEVVVEDIIVVDDKEHKIQMIRKDGYTYLNTRQLCKILGYEVDSEGRIPVLITDKKK